MLARASLEDAAISEPQSGGCGIGELRRLVRRVVVGEHHLDVARVGQGGDCLERRHDRVFLVVCGDDDGDSRPLGHLRRLAIARDHESRRHEPDHKAGNVGEEDRDHPRHDRPDRVAELVSPGL
jgi:hypothetical protein